MQIKQRWYPNGKKIIPKDLVLAPITVMNWYLGDGSSHISSYRNMYAQLSTQGFCDEGVEQLGDLLKITIGLSRVRYARIGKGLTINVQGRCDVSLFLNYANGGAPIPFSFLYKFTDKNGVLIWHIR
jgi:hypothetical protein